MKILIITSQDYPNQLISSRYYHIFDILAKNYEVHIASFNDIEHPKNSIIFHTLSSPFHLYKLSKIIKHNKIDVVVSAHPLAGTSMNHIIHKSNIPIILDLLSWIPYSTPKPNTLDLLLNNLTNSDYVTTISPFMVNKLEEYGFESKLIPNGVDTSLFKPLITQYKWKKMLGINEEDFVIGFTGSMEKWYDIDGMIRSMPELLKFNPTTKLLLVNKTLSTERIQNLQSLSISMGINRNVIFTEYQSYKDLPKFISCMDVCTIPLVPKKCKDSALPNKFFEYTACKKPIILTHMQNVIDAGEGNLFEYSTKDQYIYQVKYLMKHKFDFYIDASKYDWKYRAIDFENLFLEAVSNNYRKNRK